MKLKFREFGQGNHRGLWLHGWLGSGEEGAKLQKALGENFTLFCPDLPGHGETPLADWTREGTLEAIARLAKGCEWAGGYSMGGRLLMMAAARYPDAFTKLVIESASLGYSDEQTRLERKRLDLQRAEKLQSQGLKAFCEEWYGMEMWGGFTDFPERKGKVDDLAGALTLFSVAHQPDLRAWIITAPERILWLAGKRDPVYAELAEWVRIRTRHQVGLLNAGHNIHAQDPVTWAEKTRLFLQDQERQKEQ